MVLSRKSFLGLAGASLAGGCMAPRAVENQEKPRPAFEGIGDAPFAVGEPCLQAPGETTMGVSWSVSGLAKGVVEIADNPEMRGARTFRSGGYGLVPIDIAALQVRLEGLNPATKYWYRTVTTPFTDYANIYDAKLGAPVVGKVHSFATPGETASSHFCVINDTHADWKAFGPTVAKVKTLKPTLAVWNGDATNTTQDKATAVEIFLNPPIADRDWSADVPVAFVSGNHDFRGSWISKKEEVVLPRHPAERTGAEWDLKWNFAVRLGAVALVGMDTGEDKPDAHPKWFGLANFESYRRAQAAWLEKTLERPDIAAAKWKVVCCHIPLYAAPDHPSYPHDGAKVDPNDFAYWSRECFELWNPILENHGVSLVIAAHEHRFRIDPPSSGRRWHQVVGGGPARPTVIDVRVAEGNLVVDVRDVRKDKVLGHLALPPSAKDVSSVVALRTAMAREIANGNFGGLACASNRGILACAGNRTLNPTDGPVTPRSLFDLASVGKTHTASLCALLYAAGKLDVDAPFTEYLTEHALAKGNCRITVRDLATHSGGFDNAKPYMVQEPKKYLEQLYAKRPVRGRGENFEYACSNFVYLGLIVEKLTGLDLDAAARKMLWGPLGMTHTTWNEIVGNPDAVEYARATYDGPVRRIGEHNDICAHWAPRPMGNGANFSTAGDMLLFCTDLLRREKFPKTYYDLLFTPCFAKDGVRRSFGWDMRGRHWEYSDWEATKFSDRAIGHAGWTGPQVVVDPARDFAGVVLGSQQGGKANTMGPRMRLLEVMASEGQSCRSTSDDCGFGSVGERVKQV